VSVPIVFYNVPGRTGSNIDARTQRRLAEHGNISGVKEASGSLGQIMEVIRDRPKASRSCRGTTRSRWP